VRVTGAEPEVAAAALGVEAERDRDALQQRELAGAVLPDEEGNVGGEFERSGP